MSVAKPNVRRLAQLLAMLALTGLLAAGLAAAKPAKTKTTRLSVKANGKEVPMAAADYPAISGNGRLVAFEAFGRLVGKDTDNALDVYLYDRKTKRNKLISVKSNGKPGNNVGCGVADISPSGRYVSFACDGALVAGDNNGLEDVYRRDLKSGKTVLVSLTDSDQQLNGVDDGSEISGVADDGKVAWESYGAFVPGDTNNAFDVFVRNPSTGRTVRASVDYQGAQLENGVGSLSPDKQSKVAISGNGHFVAFSSPNKATADDDYGMAVDTDVFVRDLKHSKTERVSLRSNGQEASSSSNADSTSPSISADGRYVAFEAYPTTKLVSSDTNNSYDIYVRDRKKDKTMLATQTSGGMQPPATGLAPQFGEISPNGRFLVFDTQFNFGGGADPAMNRDVYRRDLVKKKTKLVSLKSNGGRADTNQLGDPANSGWVTFSSMGKLTGGDDGADFDVFLRGPLH